jgi:hypothetical protein
MQEDIRTACTIRLFNESKADIILFPGWTLKSPDHLEAFRKSISNIRTTAILELQEIASRSLTNALYCVQNSDLRFLSFQLFASSTEIARNTTIADIFLDEFEYSKVLKVKGKTVRIMQCGEINILRNIQSQRNRVAFRHDDEEMTSRFQQILANTNLILNPQHTPMGNQGKMHKRRQYLSTKNRVYISTCNIPSWGTGSVQKAAHYAYFNGWELERNSIYRDKYVQVLEYNFSNDK